MKGGENAEEEGLMTEQRERAAAIPVMELTDRHYNNRKCETAAACRFWKRDRDAEFLYGNKNVSMGGLDLSPDRS